MSMKLDPEVKEYIGLITEHTVRDLAEKMFIEHVKMCPVNSRIDKMKAWCIGVVIGLTFGGGMTMYQIVESFFS